MPSNHVAGRLTSQAGFGPSDERTNELILTHGMPALHAMLLGEAGQVTNRLFPKAGGRHADGSSVPLKPREPRRSVPDKLFVRGYPERAALANFRLVWMARKPFEAKGLVQASFAKTPSRKSGDDAAASRSPGLRLGAFMKRGSPGLRPGAFIRQVSRPGA